MFKICPTCKAQQPVAATICTCGHQFRTNFVNPGQTQAFFPPPAQPAVIPPPKLNDIRSRPWFWPVVGGCAVLAVGAFIVLGIIASRPQVRVEFTSFYPIVKGKVWNLCNDPLKEVQVGRIPTVARPTKIQGVVVRTRLPIMGTFTGTESITLNPGEGVEFTIPNEDDLFLPSEDLVIGDDRGALRTNTLEP